MSEDFSARYRLLKCVSVDDGMRTHNAQEIATGRVVMVHITDAAGPDEVEALRAQLAQLSNGDKNKVLETATIPSGFVIVTEFMPVAQSFPSWLASHAAGIATGTMPAPSAEDLATASLPPSMPSQDSASIPAPTAQEAVAPTSTSASPAAPATLQPDTSQSLPAMITPPSFAIQPEAPVPAPPLSQPAAPPAATPTAKAPAPGAFTQMFSAQAPPASAPVKVPSPRVEFPPKPAGTAPPADAAPPAAPPPAAPAKSAGAFTQMFGSPTASASSSAASAPASPPKPKPPSPPGGFTQTFGPDVVAAAAAIRNTPPSQFPQARAVEPPAFTPAPQQPPAPPRVKPPGEFTQMFGVPSTAAPLPERSAPSPMNADAQPSWSPFAPDQRHQSPPITPLYQQPPVQSSPMGMGLGSAPPAMGNPPSASGSHSPFLGGSANSGTPSSTPATHSNMMFAARPRGDTPDGERPKIDRPASAPSVLPPPMFDNSAATPLSAMGGAPVKAGPQAGPSDFTRIIQAAGAPVVPTVRAPEKAVKDDKKPDKSGLPVGLVIVISAVLIVAILLVAIVWRQPTALPQNPQTPGTPSLSAPKLTAPKLTTPKITAPAVTAPSVTPPAVTAPTVTPPTVTPPAVTPPAR